MKAGVMTEFDTFACAAKALAEHLLAEGLTPENVTYEMKWAVELAVEDADKRTRATNLDQFLHHRRRGAR